MSNETVRSAIEDIALRPDDVGLLHARILRDEIVELRSRVAESVRVFYSATERAKSAEQELAVMRRDVENLTAERDLARFRIRTAAQALIEVVGADGPADLEVVVERTMSKLRALEHGLDERETHAEALVEVVHDALWSEQHRDEDVGDMAKRVKAELAAIADENIALEEKLREALASTGRARYENTLYRAEKAEAAAKRMEAQWQEAERELHHARERVHALIQRAEEAETVLRRIDTSCPTNKMGLSASVLARLLDREVVETENLRTKLVALCEAGRRFELAVHGGKPQSLASVQFAEALDAAEKV